MLKTTDFIDNLMNRNNDELDDILSYADHLKQQNDNKVTEHESADDILAELDSLADSKKSESAYNNQQVQLQQTDDAAEKDDENILPDDNILNADDTDDDILKTQLLNIPENFHHLLLKHDVCNFISYKNICDEDTPASDDIADTANDFSTDMTQNDNAADHPQADNSNQNEYDTTQTDDDYDADEDEDMTESQRFMKVEGMRHPKFYFTVGISIAILTLLGLISLIYLGVSFLRNFSENYNQMQTPANIFYLYFEV